MALLLFLLLLLQATSMAMPWRGAAGLPAILHYEDVVVADLASGVISGRLHATPAAYKKKNASEEDNNRPAGVLHMNLLHRDHVVYGAKLPAAGNHRRRHVVVAELLRRDAARAAALQARRRRKYVYGGGGGGVEQEEEEEATGFGSEVVSGLEEGSGEYFVRVGIGTPPRDQYMVVDSGSDLSWVQCQPCLQCYPQSDPIFDPKFSTSFSGISCGSTICSSSFLNRPDGCTRTGRYCRYEATYGDGSYSRGTLAVETITFEGGAAAVNKVALGCGHRNSGLFVGAAGVLGLGGGPMSLVGQLAGQLGGAFGYCLVTRGGGGGGSLVFGRAAAVPAGAAWVPLVRNPRAPSLYYVALTGVGVGGARLPMPEGMFEVSDDGGGGFVMDTGTAVTRLPEMVYEALRDAFVGAAAEMQPDLRRRRRVSIFDTCYDLSGLESVRVPTVSLYFDGTTVLTLPARNFLVPVDDAGTFCFAFAASSSGSMGIMGNIQQEGIQITFDAAAGFVGFGPNTC